MPKDPLSFPFFLIGNKSDLVDERQVHKEKINSWLARNPEVIYHETSALDGSNI